MNLGVHKGLTRCRKFQKVSGPGFSLLRWGRVLATLTVACLIWLYAYADESSLEYRIKAAYIYNFTKFVEWPDQTMRNDGTSTLTLCVLGNNPFRGALKSLEGKVSQDKSLQFVQYDQGNPWQLTDCQVLFISTSEQGRLGAILERVRYASVLTVSDIENFARRGGMIGFIAQDNKIRLEINLQVAQQANLKIRAKLLEVANLVSNS